MMELAVFFAVCLILHQALLLSGKVSSEHYKGEDYLTTMERVHYYYSGFDLGVFRKSGNFKSLPLPQNPKTLGFRLFIYPPGPGTLPKEVYVSRLISSRYVRLIKPGATLMFIVHGYGASAWDWPDLVKSTAIYCHLYLVLVDWATGAGGESRLPKFNKPRRAVWPYKAVRGDYVKAASNTRVVGSIIGNVIFAIKRSGLYSIKYVHCVGFSLGAHVCGFAGKTYSRVSKLHSGKMHLLNRITGLDPSGPLFRNAEPHERLDRTDADFVDIIHTDTLLFGINRSIGHVDFWAGGTGSWGAKQPGCAVGVGNKVLGKLIRWTGSKRKRSSPDDELPEKEDSTCSHIQATRYFEQSVRRTCKYEIPKTGGLRMGFFAKKTNIPKNRRDIFVTIEERKPFCSKRQTANIRLW